MTQSIVGAVLRSIFLVARLLRAGNFFSQTVSGLEGGGFGGTGRTSSSADWLVGFTMGGRGMGGSGENVAWRKERLGSLLKEQVSKDVGRALERHILQSGDGLVIGERLELG